MGCFTHALGQYSEVLDSAPKGKNLGETASYRLRHKINQLFTIEEKYKDLSYDEIKTKRQEEARPILDYYFEDVKRCFEVAVPKTKLYEALTYSINQENKLRMYLDDGCVEISNNRAKKHIRPFCVGKKNWLFTNIVKGSQASASMYSIIESAKLNNLKPETYINYLLESFPNIQKNDDQELEKYIPQTKELAKELYLIK